MRLRVEFIDDLSTSCMAMVRMLDVSLFVRMVGYGKWRRGRMLMLLRLLKLEAPPLIVRPSQLLLQLLIVALYHSKLVFLLLELARIVYLLHLSADRAGIVEGGTHEGVIVRGPPIAAFPIANEI